MRKLELLPCSDCGKTGHTVFIEQINGVWQGVCRCGHATMYCSTREDAITAWNNPPRMSTIIAWQFQAAGLALENQRLRKMVDWLADKMQTASKESCSLTHVCPGGQFNECHASYHCSTCWAEAARRAVEGK